MPRYEGKVVSAMPCPYWTEVFENKILNNCASRKPYGYERKKNLADLLEDYEQTKNLSLQGFSLICLINTDNGWQHVEVYVYGCGRVEDGKATYLEVLQIEEEYYELFELSLEDEHSWVTLKLEGLDNKLINGEVRNVKGMRRTPLLKCRFSRLVDTWLPSERVVDVREVPAAPAAQVHSELVAS